MRHEEPSKHRLAGVKAEPTYRKKKENYNICRKIRREIELLKKEASVKEGS